MVGAALSRAWSAHFSTNTPESSYPFYTGDWLAYSRILTFLGGLKSNRISLYLTDIVHHHFGVAALLLASPKRAGRGLNHLLQAFGRLGGFALSPFPNHTSTHLHLASLLAAGLGGLTLPSQPLNGVPTPYLYLSYDYLETTALDLHDSSIALFLMMGSHAHGGIFLIREIKHSPLCGLNLRRILAHKGGIISHLT